MRTAPAVVIPLEADTPWRAGLCLLHGCAAATSAAWLVLLADGSSVAAAACAVAAALLAGALAWRLARHDGGELGWDGTQWSLRLPVDAPETTGLVQPMVDLGGWLLLRFTPAAGQRRACWIALSQASHPAAWHALRAAVYCPAPADDSLSAPRR